MTNDGAWGGHRIQRETFALVRWAAEWEALEEMRDFASIQAARRFGGDLADRARIAGNELLENAVRYATAGSQVVLELREVRDGFEILVSNEAVESRVALLRKRIQELSEPGAVDAYRRALRKLLTDNGAFATGGGLGLLRARHEAGVDINVEVTGKRVTVSAIGLGGAWPTNSSQRP